MAVSPEAARQPAFQRPNKVKKDKIFLFKQYGGFDEYAIY
jgi:hypothetical protein